MIRFLAEVAKKTDASLSPVPSNGHSNAAGGTGVIYEADIGPPPADTYWDKWIIGEGGEDGEKMGYFGGFVAERVLPYYAGFLSPVETLKSLKDTPNSVFVERRRVLMNLPQHPWLYPNHVTTVAEPRAFLSAPLYPDNPSDNLIRTDEPETAGELAAGRLATMSRDWGYEWFRERFPSEALEAPGGEDFKIGDFKIKDFEIEYFDEGLLKIALPEGAPISKSSLEYGRLSLEERSRRMIEDGRLSLEERLSLIEEMTSGRIEYGRLSLEEKYRRGIEDGQPSLTASVPDPSLTLRTEDTLRRGIEAQVRLDPPNFAVKLSDSIAGIILHQGFSISLHNDDGYFDDEEEWNVFNTPLFIKKATVENPRYADFAPIRDGFVENKRTGFAAAQIDVADRFKSLDEPVCDIIRRGDFGLDENSEALNQPIPLVFGSARIKLIKLDEQRFLTAENADEVRKVFGKDGKPIDNYMFDKSTKLITMSGGETIEPDEALVSGISGNDRIGHVVRTLAARAGIPFTDTNFNMVEFNGYANGSFEINMAITGGSVRGAIEKVLRNDMAFLIQQNDGKFTMRRYGEDYGRKREIDTRLITKAPEKDYGRAQENYFSSCVIEFVDKDDRRQSIMFDEMEEAAEVRYQRTMRRTFDTNLTNAKDALSFARLLSGRYTSMRQTVRLAVGCDTAEMELLDMVTMKPDQITNPNATLTINGREFSRATCFIVKEINHAQDILVLEEIDRCAD